VGAYAQGYSSGAAVGFGAKGMRYGVALGYQAGYNINTTADRYNTLVGAYSGYQLTTGIGNIIIGYGAGRDSTYSPTTGSYNILIGYNAWTPTNTTSKFLNIGGLIFGTNLSTTTNTISSGNVGIGTTTPDTKLSIIGGRLKVGEGNSSDGYIRLGTTEGSIIGTNGGVSLNYNGLWIGVNETDANIQADTALPSWAVDIGGFDNIIFPGTSDAFRVARKPAGGSYSEFMRITNNGNVGIGTTSPDARMAIISSTSTAFSLAVGTTTAYSMVVSTTGNVGIGTTNPSFKLHVVGGGDGSGNIVVTNSGITSGVALYDNGTIFTIGSGNVGIGTTGPGAKLEVMQTDTSKSYSLKIGTSSTAYHLVVSTTGNVGIGTTGPLTNLHIVEASNNALTIRMDAGSTAGQWVSFDLRDRGTPKWTFGKTNINDFYIDDQSGGRALTIKPISGNVGIGTTNPGYKLDVQGQIRQTYTTDCNYLGADLNGAIYCYGSSIRYKTNINDLNFDIDKFLTLNPKSFDWNTKTIDFVPSEKGSVGFIAEEVEKVIPQLVRYKDGQPDGVKYDLIPVYMFKVIQEQQKQIEYLKTENSNLKTRIEALESKLNVGQ